MTRKRRRPSSDPTRASVREAAIAAREAARQGEQIDLDPASELFFAFAGPLLLQARNDQEFTAAAEIAEFVWFTSHLGASSQVELLDKFIAERNVPAEMIPWLVDVFAELSARKQILAG
ncbi:MAG: hypothetical protein ACREH3_06935 [Geminicoccales bacterium]